MALKSRETERERGDAKRLLAVSIHTGAEMGPGTQTLASLKEEISGAQIAKADFYFSACRLRGGCGQWACPPLPGTWPPRSASLLPGAAAADVSVGSG